MNKSRETIAKAIAAAAYGPKRWDELTGMQRYKSIEIADAVIAALEGMGTTDAMAVAYWRSENMQPTDIWRAMVGAMRDE
jgi:hypothetical protein